MSDPMEMFYDVPCVSNISMPQDFVGGYYRRVGGRMAVAIFSCPFAAMSFASKARHSDGFGQPLNVNRRVWSEAAFAHARIADFRGIENGAR